MDYHIKSESGMIIASFVNESDRDYCIDTLRELYEDCKFDKAND